MPKHDLKRLKQIIEANKAPDQPATSEVRKSPTPAAGPTPAPLPALAAQGDLDLTRLLTQCFEFEMDASKEERKLLSDILEEWKKGPHSFPVVAASRALHALKAQVGVDALDNDHFCELLNLFSDAVSGWGYGGFREKLIGSLLRHGKTKMKFDDALAILMLEFEEIHTDIGVVRNTLRDNPEQLADEIAKAAETLKKRSMGASNAE